MPARTLAAPPPPKVCCVSSIFPPSQTANRRPEQVVTVTGLAPVRLPRNPTSALTTAPRTGLAGVAGLGLQVWQRVLWLPAAVVW